MTRLSIVGALGIGQELEELLRVEDDGIVIGRCPLIFETRNEVMAKRLDIDDLIRSNPNVDPEHLTKGRKLLREIRDGKKKEAESTN